MGEFEKRTKKIVRNTFLNIERNGSNFKQAKETSHRSLEIHKEEIIEDYLAEGMDIIKVTNFMNILYKVLF